MLRRVPASDVSLSVGIAPPSNSGFLLVRGSKLLFAACFMPERRVLALGSFVLFCLLWGKEKRNKKGADEALNGVH